MLIISPQIIEKSTGVDPTREYIYSCDTAEVAAIDSQGNFITHLIDDRADEFNNNIGYLTTDEVLEFLNKCQAYKPEEVTSK